MVISAGDYMNMNLGFAYRYLDNKDIINKMHTHNFQEYFLIITGSIIHIVNGQKSILNAGDLVFIRQNDAHMYRQNGQEKCELINVSFAKDYFQSASEYLGQNIKDIILNPALPPKVTIPNYNIPYLVKNHDFFNFTGINDENIIVKFKLLLVQMLSMFMDLNNQKSEPENTKTKLECMFEKMNTQENIEEGLAAMLRLTGFSHGHLCRVMKETYFITPNEYLTELRMNYASNLLINSNMDILTISLKVGYTSLSHFIKVFKTRFGESPYRYKQSHAKLERKAI